MKTCMFPPQSPVILVKMKVCTYLPHSKVAYLNVDYVAPMVIDVAISYSEKGKHVELQPFLVTYRYDTIST